MFLAVEHCDCLSASRRSSVLKLSKEDGIVPMKSLSDSPTNRQDNFVKWPKEEGE